MEVRIVRALGVLLTKVFAVLYKNFLVLFQEILGPTPCIIYVLFFDGRYV